MRPILILTKNLLTEQQLQKQLQHLNYEVFCSVTLLNQLRSNSNRTHIIQNYQAVIFSETLTNLEIRKLLVVIPSEGNLLVRKLMHEPSKKETDELKKMGINMWIYDSEPLDLLREHLALHLMNCQKKEASNIVFLYQKDDSPKTLAEFKSRLTKKECKTFDCLVAGEGELISRETLCNYIWKGAPNNSRLTQLSVLVKRIKTKLNEAGFQEELIHTVWGNGYRLSPKLIHFYKQKEID